LFGFITRSPRKPVRYRNADGDKIRALARECQTVFAGEPDRRLRDRRLLPLRPLKGIWLPASCPSDGIAGISVHRKSAHRKSAHRKIGGHWCHRRARFLDGRCFFGARKLAAKRIILRGARGKLGRTAMFKGMAGAAALMTAVLMTPVSPAAAFDEMKYPDLSGQWRKPPGIGNQWDQSKPLGRAQQPPLTPEYQAVFEASMADQREGGQGNDPPSRCVPFGMPRIMTVVFSMEIIIKPETTHILFDHSCRAASTPMGGTGPERSSRAFSAIPSASGSTKTATAATTRWKSRPAA
jgi:hypothetical protein